MHKQSIKYLLFVFFSIIFNVHAFSQSTADSLIRVLKTIENDSLKAKTLNNICWELKSTDPELKQLPRLLR